MKMKRYKYVIVPVAVVSGRHEGSVWFNDHFVSQMEASELFQKMLNAGYRAHMYIGHDEILFEKEINHKQKEV